MKNYIMVETMGVTVRWTILIFKYVRCNKWQVKII